MGEPTVNGDMPHSAFLEHVGNYPVVSDSIGVFKSNAYGQKSIDLTNATYAKFVKPTFPYLEKPASYAKPYVAKVDEIGDAILSKVDERVPIVKSETAEIKSTIFDYVNWPFKFAGEQKDYVLGTYGDEYKKCGGDGVVAGSKALVSGSFVMASDYGLLRFLAPEEEEEAESKAIEAKKTAESKAGEVKKTAESKAGEVKKTVQEKTSN